MTRSDTSLPGHQVSCKEKRIIAVVGDRGSGKTCLIKHLLQKDATSSLRQHISTLDESHYTMKKMPDGKHEQIQIIDTAPWMEFPVMHQLYIRNSQIVIIVYDCTAKLWKESLTNKINHIQDIKADASILVVGTHTDKTNMMMNCVPSHVQEVIGRTPHVYTSSVTGFGISYLWHKLLRNKSELTEGHNIIDSNKTSVHRSRSNSTPVASSKSMRKVLRKTSALLLCSSKYHTL